MSEIIDGVTIKLNGKEYVVPSLNFKSLRQLTAEIKTLSTIDKHPTPDQMDAMVKIVHMALKRNYPELTVDNVEDMIDLGNASNVIRAIMGASGMVSGAAGANAGELAAAS